LALVDHHLGFGRLRGRWEQLNNHFDWRPYIMRLVKAGGPACYHFATQLLGTTQHKAASGRWPMLDNGRFIGHFITEWYPMLLPLPNSKTGGWGFESLHSCQSF
jgi:hypothetical protein